jgi:beta-lactam-binding protein with PASTA domain
VIVLLLLLAASIGLWAAPGKATFESGTVRAVPAARVPNVTGLETRYAVRRVRRAGLVPAQTRCRASASIWAVRSQRPAAGRTVPKGTRVILRLEPVHSQGVRTPCSAYSGPLP